jgi:ABC-2 type transport system permease protein
MYRMRGFYSGFRLQISFFRNYPDAVVPLLTAPLFAVLFALILRSGGRGDLSGYSVIAAFYMTLWRFAVFNGGWVILTERWGRTIDYLVAAPTSFASVILGRISSMMVAGAAAFVELWLFGEYVLRANLTIHHLLIFIVSVMLTLFAMTTTSLFMSNLFVLSRAAQAYSNSLSYPVYLLGCVLVPVNFLPGWLQPVTKVIFLSWSARLLQGSFQEAPIAHAQFDLAMLIMLGLAALVAASVMLEWNLRRIRLSGELTLR